MTANARPLQGLTGDHSRNNSTTAPALITLAANVYDASDGDEALIHTAGTNGSYVRAVHFEAAGSNVASVARVYVKIGGSAAILIGSVALPATTASASTPTAHPVVAINRKLAATDTLLVGLGTAVAAGWYAHAEAEQF